MVRLLDGPAAGVTLLVRRAPLFLRAVRAAGGEWDALDQLADRPDADEAITVYRRDGDARTVHIDFSRHRSGWYQLAEYHVVDPQPDDATLRNQSSYETWALRMVHGAALSGLVADRRS